MPKISLTDFVDFAACAGRHKLNLVKRVSKRGPYGPEKDFWKLMRESIVTYHEAGIRQRAVLDQTLEFTDNEAKLKNYAAAIEGYKRFLGRFAHPIAVEERQRVNWQRHGLLVRVNPELSMRYRDGTLRIVKLYFKRAPLSNQHADAALQLMEHGLRNEVGPQAHLCVLDVQRGRLYTSKGHDLRLGALLDAEAFAFVNLWYTLDRAAA